MATVPRGRCTMRSAGCVRQPPSKFVTLSPPSLPMTSRPKRARYFRHSIKCLPVQILRCASSSIRTIGVALFYTAHSVATQRLPGSHTISPTGSPVRLHQAQELRADHQARRLLREHRQVWVHSRMGQQMRSRISLMLQIRRRDLPKVPHSFRLRAGSHRSYSELCERRARAKISELISELWHVSHSLIPIRDKNCAGTFVGTLLSKLFGKPDVSRFYWALQFRPWHQTPIQSRRVRSAIIHRKMISPSTALSANA